MIRELVERTGATNIGVELDASHLFWQWMDPVAVVQDLGPLVFHAAAKDVRINPAAAVYGVLDNRFRKLGPDEPRTNLGGDEWANEWPKDAAWDFVALGRGHDAVYWSTWLAALYVVDPDMLVNIEHEDVTLGRIEGLEVASGYCSTPPGERASPLTHQGEGLPGAFQSEFSVARGPGFHADRGGLRKRRTGMINGCVEVLEGEGHAFSLPSSASRSRVRRALCHISSVITSSGLLGQTLTVQAGAMQVEPGNPEPCRHRNRLFSRADQLIGPIRVDEVAGHIAGH